jgi:hypothetical protein
MSALHIICLGCNQPFTIISPSQGEVCMDCLKEYYEDSTADFAGDREPWGE